MFLPDSVNNSSGFTLVELITTLVIISVLAAVTYPKFFHSRSFSERGFFEQFINTVRYAQKVAIGSHCDVQVSISTSSYSLNQPIQAECGASPVSFPIAVRSPSGKLSGNVPDSVSISGSSFTFDASGAPSSTQTITVGSLSFKIHNTTGYVEKL